VDLFIDIQKTADIMPYLQANNINVLDYGEIGDKIIEYSGSLENKKIQVDAEQASYYLFDLLESNGFQIHINNKFLPYLKCHKNKIQ
jgi:hypothetical protein